MKTKFILLSGLMVLASTQSWAGGREGHGGDSVFYAGKWQLLDLVEAGGESSNLVNVWKEVAAFPEFKRAHEQFQKIILNKFQDREGFTQEFRDLLAASLVEQSGWGNIGFLISGIRLYDWRMVDAELKDIADEESPLELSRMQKRQVAVRLDQSILIHRESFFQLSLTHQVALIYHEILYAFLKPQLDGEGKLRQSSYRARQGVARIFRLDPNCDLSTTDYDIASIRPIWQDDTRIYVGGENYRGIVMTGEPMIVTFKEPIHPFEERLQQNFTRSPEGSMSRNPVLIPAYYDLPGMGADFDDPETWPKNYVGRGHGERVYVDPHVSACESIRVDARLVQQVGMVVVTYRWKKIMTNIGEEYVLGLHSDPIVDNFGDTLDTALSGTLDGCINASKAHWSRTIEYLRTVAMF